MSGVTYHGEYPLGVEDEDGNPFIVQHGYTFVKGGKSVSVTDKALLAKFQGNRFFKTEGSDKEDVEQGKDEAEQAELVTLQTYLADEGVPFHRNTGVGKLREMKEAHEKAIALAQAD